MSQADRLKSIYGDDYYRNIRKKVKKHPGGSFRDKKFASKMGKLGGAASQREADLYTTSPRPKLPPSPEAG